MALHAAPTNGATMKSHNWGKSNTTNAKMNVNTTSAINACNISPSPKLLEPVAVGPSCPPVETRVK